MHSSEKSSGFYDIHEVTTQKAALFTAKAERTIIQQVRSCCKHEHANNDSYNLRRQMADPLLIVTQIHNNMHSCGIQKLGVLRKSVFIFVISLKVSQGTPINICVTKHSLNSELNNE